MVRAIHVTDPRIGRSVDEELRLLQALQHYEQHGEGVEVVGLVPPPTNYG